MKRRTITLTTPEKKNNTQRFYADRRNAILDAVESTLSDATGELYIKYADGHGDWIEDTNKLLYLIETWLLRESRGTMDAGLVYLVGGKRYALHAVTQEIDFDEDMQTLQPANKKR